MKGKEKKQEEIIVGKRKIVLPQWEEEKGSKRRISLLLIIALIVHIAIGSFMGAVIIFLEISERTFLSNFSMISFALFK